MMKEITLTESDWPMKGFWKNSFNLSHCVSASLKMASVTLFENMSFRHSYCSTQTYFPISHLDSYSFLVWFEKEKYILWVPVFSFLQWRGSWGTSMSVQKVSGPSLARNWPEMETLSLSFSRRTFFSGSLTSTDPTPAARNTQRHNPHRSTHIHILCLDTQYHTQGTNHPGLFRYIITYLHDLWIKLQGGFLYHWIH